MAAKNKDKPKKNLPDKRANFSEPELFGRVNEIFKGRNLNGLNLLQQLRMALGEWCDSNEAKVHAPRHPE